MPTIVSRMIAATCRAPSTMISVAQVRQGAVALLSPRGRVEGRPVEVGAEVVDDPGQVCGSVAQRRGSPVIEIEPAVAPW